MNLSWTGLKKFTMGGQEQNQTGGGGKFGNYTVLASGSQGGQGHKKIPSRFKKPKVPHLKTVIK